MGRLDRIVHALLSLATAALICSAPPRAEAQSVALQAAQPGSRESKASDMPYAVDARPAPRLTVLCWHDVRDTPLSSREADPDTTAITTRDLVAQFELIRALGYTPISLQQWLDARDHGAALPPRPLLLTFDDGLRSVYTRVYPLLRAYRYPALVAVIGQWLQDGPPTDEGPIALLSWPQLREMQASGLVEVASHSHALHRGLPANPQGDLQPAGAARLWLGDRYESDDQASRRIEDDLQQSSRTLERELGQRPRAVAWPFGAYSDLAIDAARRVGFSVALSLDNGNHTLADSPLGLRRQLVHNATSPTALARLLQPDAPGLAESLGTLRMLRVSLDPIVADADDAEREARIERLVKRVRALGVNAVQIDAYADPTHSGQTGTVYYPLGGASEGGVDQAGTHQGGALADRHRTPPGSRADLLSHVAWRLHRQAAVKVFAALPADAPDRAYIALVRQVPLTGVVLREDVHWQGDDRQALPDRAALVTQLRALRGEQLVLRQIDAADALAPLRGEAAPLPTLLQHYDFVVVRTLNRIETAMLPERWFGDLVTAVGPRANHRTIFEADRSEALDGAARLLAAGARHMAVQDDDFTLDQPALSALRPLLSTATRFNQRQ